MAVPLRPVAPSGHNAQPRNAISALPAPNSRYSLISTPRYTR